MTTQIITDNSLMPFGKHAGKKMSEVPDDYLLWLYEQPPYFDTPEIRGVFAYIKDNLNALKANATREKKSRNALFNPYQ